MVRMALRDERGLVNPLVIVVIILALLVISSGGFGVWSYMNYVDQRDNVTQKVQDAVSAAVAKQSSTDAAKFAEEAKLPTVQFVGPSDLGSVKFNYPKTWSGFVASNTNGAYQAYFQPGLVPPISTNSQYALRVSILGVPYDAILATFQNLMTNGSITAAAVTAGGETGIRLEGKIESNVNGVMVIMKIRDQTLEIYTESRSFQPDFDKTILPSLTFNR
ncbi:MAG TPA: hypothetical protein VNG90_02955 [Candidatus Acidoferrum sp.]|nr:hypothetical protein [Candidatus Acidoferrum sp.]